MQGDYLDLFVSKLLDRPMQLLDYKVGRLVGEIEEPIAVFENMKLMMYDAHDS